MAENGNNGTRFSALDSWEVSGSNEQELLQTLKELAKATAAFPVEMDEISLLTIVGEENGNIVVLRHDQTPIREFKSPSADTGADACFSIPAEKLLNAADGNAELVNEALKKTMTLLIVRGKLYFISDSIWVTLRQRLGGLGGDFITMEHLAIRRDRDSLATKRAQIAGDQAAQVLVKREGNVRKVFSVFTDKYRIVTQAEIFLMLKKVFEQEMGKMEIKNYKIDNFFTEILISFPEKAKDISSTYGKGDRYTPVVQIHSSDVGMCSVIINGGFLRDDGKHTCLLLSDDMSTSRAHTKRTSAEAIVKEASQVIFAKATRIPDRMAELIQKDVSGIVAQALVQVIAESDFMALSKLLGKERAHSLLPKLYGLFNDTTTYTLYDVATAFLEIPEMLDIENVWIDRREISDLRKRCMKAVFVDYDKLLAHIPAALTNPSDQTGVSGA